MMMDPMEPVSRIRPRKEDDFSTQTKTAKKAKKAKKAMLTMGQWTKKKVLLMVLSQWTQSSSRLLQIQSEGQCC